MHIDSQSREHRTSVRRSPRRERTNERTRERANERLFFLFRDESRIPLARRIVKFWKIYRSLPHRATRYRQWRYLPPCGIPDGVSGAKNEERWEARVWDGRCYIFKRSIISPVRWILTDWSRKKREKERWEKRERGEKQGERKRQREREALMVNFWMARKRAPRVVCKNDKWTMLRAKRSIGV